MKLSKLLKETKIKVLKEDEVDDKVADLSKAFQTDSVPAYVSLLQQYQSDPKVLAVLKAGVTDGKPDDEKFAVGSATLAVKDLKPTQNEIGAQESIKNIVTDEYGSLKTFLQGTADVGGPIITYNGEYVLDGHHRWSQVYAANPDAKIPAINVTGKLDPKDILKAVHTAIAVDAGQTKTIAANLKAGNLLTYSDDDVKKMVEDNLQDKARNVWKDFGFDSDDKILKRIQDNVKEMLSKSKPESWAPKRDSMPQPDASGAKDWGVALKKGEVNLIDPRKSDVKDSYQPKNLDSKLFEAVLKKSIKEFSKITKRKK